MVLESSHPDVGGGYRASMWSFSRTQCIDLVSHRDLEHQSCCLDVSLLTNAQPDYTKPDAFGSFGGQKQKQLYQNATSQTAQVYLHNTMQFITVEKTCIKIWSYYQGNFDLQKKIVIKQAIKSCVIAQLTGFFLILGDNGKLLILDQKGEFVSTVSKEGVIFTVIGTASDKLLLGTDKGSIHVYHMASLKFVAEIPYQMALLANGCLNLAQTMNDLRAGLSGP